MGQDQALRAAARSCWDPDPCPSALIAPMLCFFPPTPDHPRRALQAGEEARGPEDGGDGDVQEDARQPQRRQRPGQVQRQTALGKGRRWRPHGGGHSKALGSPRRWGAQGTGLGGANAALGLFGAALLGLLVPTLLSPSPPRCPCPLCSPSPGSGSLGRQPSRWAAWPCPWSSRRGTEDSSSWTRLVFVFIFSPVPKSPPQRHPAAP